MKQRYILLTIDTIAAILADYIDEEDLPSTAHPVKMLMNPTDKRFAIEFIDDSWNGSEAPINVNFKLKRIFSGS